MKEYENKLFSFNVTFVKSQSPTRITLKFLTHDCLGALYLNSREHYVGGVIPWGHHDRKSLGATQQIFISLETQLPIHCY